MEEHFLLSTITLYLMMFPPNYAYNPHTFGLIPYPVAQNAFSRQRNQNSLVGSSNNCGPIPNIGPPLNTFNNVGLAGSQMDPMGLDWNNLSVFPNALSLVSLIYYYSMNSGGFPSSLNDVSLPPNAPFPPYSYNLAPTDDSGRFWNNAAPAPISAASATLADDVPGFQ